MRAEFTPWAIRGMALAIGIAIVVGLVATVAAAIDVVVLLFVAVLLASALEPVVGTVRGRVPLGRGSTILLVYLAFFVSVIGLALIIVPTAISQGEEVIAGLPAFFESAQAWAGTLRPEILSTSVSAVLGSVAEVVTPGAATGSRGASPRSARSPPKRRSPSRRC